MKTKKQILNFAKIASVVFTSFILLLTASFLAREVETPTYINNAQDLLKINDNLSGYYLFSKDISLYELFDDENFDGWIPIGTKDKPFTGKIDFNYHKIIGLSFSNTYIENQNKNLKNEKIPVGFIGYSSGIVIHANFYRPTFPDITITVDNGNEIIFGFICAVNNGYVTSSMVALDNSSGTFNINSRCCYGTIVGLNNSQVLIAKVINTILYNAANDCVIGGVIGECSVKSVNSFLFKGGYTEIKSFAFCNVICGGVIGRLTGGSVSDAYCGPVQRGSTDNSVSVLGDCDNVVLGGVIGEIAEGDDTIISNCYLNNRLIINGLYSNSYMGGIIGHNYCKKTKISNSLVQSNFVISNQTNFICDMTSPGAELQYYINNFSITKSMPSIATNNYSQFITFSEISLSILRWPTNTKTCYWEKEEIHFYLILL